MGQKGSGTMYGRHSVHKYISSNVNKTENKTFWYEILFLIRNILW